MHFFQTMIDDDEIAILTYHAEREQSVLRLLGTFGDEGTSLFMFHCAFYYVFRDLCDMQIFYGLVTSEEIVWEYNSILEEVLYKTQNESYHRCSPHSLRLREL